MFLTNCSGVLFTLWAPGAKQVHVIGEFNRWCDRSHPLRKVRNSSVWELFIPFLKEGQKYQFCIENHKGEKFIKADPFARATEKRPGRASVIAEADLDMWHDDAWIKQRQRQTAIDQPIHIYEVHLGSWQVSQDEFMNYREIAPKLSSHCKAIGCNYVELLPVMGHPLDESWGYQVTGFFAVTPRYGSLRDFQYLIDHLHQEGIGVILDWVPGHFPKDEHGLISFDGTPLFEDNHPLRGVHPEWSTAVFDYSKPEVRNFLISSALLFFDKFHLDGLRVDAVSSILYLDFCKEPHEWEPNEDGGREHLAGIAFLKQLTASIKAEHPEGLLIAEESHYYPKVTRPVSEGGLGFDMKWAMGWMNDTLKFMEKPSENREACVGLILHELSYFFDDYYLLALSHDEVVHGKKSLLAKMPGDEWEKFANLRLLISYMIAHPGKKLLFMGSELAQWAEWDVKGQLHWELLDLFYHRAFYTFFTQISHLYKTCEPFYSGDYDPASTRLIDGFGAHPLLLVLERGKGAERILSLHNFSKEPIFFAYPIEVVEALEFFNTDCIEFGGRGASSQCQYRQGRLEVEIPYLSSVFIKVKYDDN